MKNISFNKKGYSFIKFGKRNEYYNANLNLAELIKFLFIDKRIFLQPFRVTCKKYSFRSLIEFTIFQIKIFKRSIFHLYRYLKYKLNIKAADELLCFETFGEFCVIVNKGHKIFNFRHKVVRKIFQKKIKSEDIEKEIKKIKKSQNTKVAVKLIRSNLAEKWYEEELIMGRRDFSHYPRKKDELMKYFQANIIPALIRIMCSDQIVLNNLGSIFNLYYKELNKNLYTNKYLKYQAKVETDKFLNSQIKFFKEKAASNIYFGFSHGDFCPANIINTSNGIKIIDWENAGIRSLLFDYYSYLFYRPVHQIYEDFHLLKIEIDQTLNNFIKSLNINSIKIKKSIDRDQSIYRHIYYVERIIMLIERSKEDKKLNISHILVDFINAFIKYEEKLNTASA